MRPESHAKTAGDQVLYRVGAVALVDDVRHKTCLHTIAVTDGADAPGTGQTDKVLVGEVFQPDALFAGIGRICRHCQKDAFLEQLIAVFVAGRDLEILPCENRDVRILALGVLEKLKVQPVVILLIGDQRLGHQRRCRQHVQTDGGLPFLRQVLELVRNLVQRL